MLSAVPGTLRHARQVACRLRTADAEEAKALTGGDPVTAVIESYLQSVERFAILSGRTPVAVGGIGRHDELGWMVWMVGTDDLKSIEFIRESRPFFESLARRYKKLTNFVHDRNRLHIRWLEWLGVDFDTEVYWINGEPFRRFTYVHLCSPGPSGDQCRKHGRSVPGPVECGTRSGQLSEPPVPGDLEVGA